MKHHVCEVLFFEQFIILRLQQVPVLKGLDGREPMAAGRLVFAGHAAAGSNPHGYAVVPEEFLMSKCVPHDCSYILIVSDFLEKLRRHFTAGHNYKP